LKIIAPSYLVLDETDLKGGVRLAVKIIELIGISKKSWEDAVQEAISKSAKTIHNIHGVHVVGFKANVEKGRISEYRANVKIAFIVD
jgi:dodecin